MRKTLVVVLFAACSKDAAREANMKVVEDMTKQYEIVSRRGDRVEMCIRAGLVAEAWLQANVAERYNEWKDIAARDCEGKPLPERSITPKGSLKAHESEDNEDIGNAMRGN